MKRSKSGRPWIIAAYVVLFWLVLPVFISRSAWFLDRRLSLAMPPSIARAIIGGLLTAFAAWMLFRAIRDFRQFGAELPVSALPPNRIIQQGLYTYWRHPIYVFYALLFAGLGLAFGSGGLLLVMLPLLILGEVPYVLLEERALVRRFGKAYEDYRRRAPLIVPRLGTVLRPLFNIICRLLFNWEIRHAERVPAEPPFFVVAAHRNYLDPFFVAYPVRFPVCFVTTFEMFRSPLRRFVFRRFLCIPKRRYLNDVGAGREIVARLRQGYVIGVFPEGERSWTGRTLDWKPEAVALLKRFPDVPVLPIRVDGDYLSWPRWAQGIRRAKLTITVQEPFWLRPDMAAADVERELRNRIEPDDSGTFCRGDNHAGGLTKVIYRCPACGSFETLTLTGSREVACPSCSTSFSLQPDYTLRYRTGNHDVVESLPSVYERIRIRESDITSVGETGEAVIASCRSAVLWREEGNRMRRLGTGSVELRTSSLDFAGFPSVPFHPVERGEEGEAGVTIPLEHVRSVTTESNRKLQIYDGSARRLWQLTFENESVLKWQDLIVETIRHKFKFEPNWR